jgi:acyl carrier protein
MRLTAEEIRERVIDALREVLNGREVLRIDDRTDPLKDLGLDSEDGIAVACALSEKLDYHIPDDLNPLVDDAKQRARRVGDIVDLMHRLLANESRPE